MKNNLFIYWKGKRSEYENKFEHNWILLNASKCPLSDIQGMMFDIIEIDKQVPARWVEDNKGYLGTRVKSHHEELDFDVDDLVEAVKRIKLQTNQDL